MNGLVMRESGPSTPWVIGICSVLFDIDKGQTLQHLHPVDCISDEEQASVAFHSFPDSLSMELYTRNAIKDSSFEFRIKRSPLKLSSDGLPIYMHGYVFCRQRQDETLKRGGEQAAVMVLSDLPISSVLQPLSHVAGHAFFNEGPTALEQVYSQVQTWPAPIPGTHMSLPVGQAVMNGRIPHFSLLPPPQPTVDPAAQVHLARKASRTISLRRGFSSASSLSRYSSGSSCNVAGAATTPTLQEHEAALAAPAVASLHADQESTPATPVGDATAAASPASFDMKFAAAGNSNGLLEGGNGSSSSGLLRGHSGSSSVTSPTGSGSWSVVAAAAAAAAAETPRANSRLQYSSRQDSSGLPSTPTAAVAAGSSGSSSDPQACPSWINASLGQQWKQETPFPEVDIAAVLSPLLRHLWTLWQVLITGQPLMVVGLTPRDTSLATAALLCLIAPLPYAADYRPYFTIHDQDFIPISRGKLPTRTLHHEQVPTAAAAAAAEEIVTELAQQQRISPQAEQQCQQQQQQQQQQGCCQPARETAGQPDQTAAGQAGPHHHQQQQHGPDLPALLGVTNLYFIKALPNFPNVVAVSKKEAVVHSRSNSFGGSSNHLDTLAAQPAAAAAGAAAAGAAGAAGAQSPAAAAAAPRRGLISSTAAAAVRALKRRHNGPQHLLTDFSHHLWTASKPFIKPDYQLSTAVTATLEKEQAAAAGVAAAAAAATGAAHRQLKRHFGELTAAFLSPFTRYLEPGANGKVPRWCPEAFLSSLASQASLLPPVLIARLSSSSAAVSLYRQFLESPNFEYWFRQQRQPVMHLVEQQQQQQQQEKDGEDDLQDEVQEIDGFAVLSNRQASGTVAADKPAAAAAAAGDNRGAKPLDEVQLVQALLSAEKELAAAINSQQQQQQQQQQLPGPGEVLFPVSEYQRQQQQQQCDEAVEQQLGILALQIQLVSAFGALSHDLQVALISNPDRRQLLQQSVAALVVQEGQGVQEGSVAAAESGGDVDGGKQLQHLQQLQHRLIDLDCSDS